jgi:hypothetical protein
MFRTPGLRRGTSGPLQTELIPGFQWWKLTSGLMIRLRSAVSVSGAVLDVYNSFRSRHFCQMRLHSASASLTASSGLSTP